MLNHATGDWYKRKNQPRIYADRHGSKTNKGRIGLKAWKSHSKVKFGIVYQSCLFRISQRFRSIDERQFD
jgi:hypothetical protein